MSSAQKHPRPFKAIIIGGSAGSFQLVNKLLARLDGNFSIPIIICLHRLRDGSSSYEDTLSVKSVLPVIEPEDKTPISAGHVYIAPANYHLSIEHAGFFSLSSEDPVNNSRPSIDIAMETAAFAYKHELLGILLSGANKDGAEGMKSIQDHGGYTIVQDPEESTFRYMPQAALKIIKADQVLMFDQIVEFLNQL